MLQKNKKQKWYEELWGLLWTLAIVDAHPGQGVRVFMELDRELQSLTDSSDEKPVHLPLRPRSKSRKPCRPCPAAV